MSGVDYAKLISLADDLLAGPCASTRSTTQGIKRRARFLAGVTVAIAEHRRHSLGRLTLLEDWGHPRAVRIPPEAAHPELLGLLHERLLGSDIRTRRGAFYTPGDVASLVVSWALGEETNEQDNAEPLPVVCDPAVGGGAFLLAAAEALAGQGYERETVVQQCLIGVDIDPLSAAVSEASLALWCEGNAIPRILVGDALTMGADEWPATPDVVIGNPPFLSQLSLRTARTREQAQLIEELYGDGKGGYADTAALFWLMAARLVNQGGRVALVLPRSVLAVRDATSVRRSVLDEMIPEVLWLPGKKLFGASVDVCVVSAYKQRPSSSTRLRTYVDVPPVLEQERTINLERLRECDNWSQLLADAMGVPDVAFPSDSLTIGDRWQVVADFRDEYYGVAPYVVDDPDDLLDDERFARLVTVGLIDPARCLWGQAQARFSRQRWEAPRVDLEALRQQSRFGNWAAARLVPKVVLATQTAVLEAAVDEKGVWLPMTPSISVIADADELWHVAAVLLSPVASAWSLRNAAGAALVRGGIKLSASQVRAMPLPSGANAWDQSAALVHEASELDNPAKIKQMLLVAGELSTKAYGQDEVVTTWWKSRFPTPRSLGG